MYGWHADGCGIETPGTGKTGLDGFEAGNAELLRSFRHNSRVGINHCGKLDRLARLFQLAIDAKMVAPEGPRPNDSDAQWVRGGHYFLSVRFSSGASTTWRQRA